MNIGKRTAGVLCLLMILLSGCGQTELPGGKETCIFLQKGGSLTYTLVDDFDKEYYNVYELADMAKRETVEFNQRFYDEVSGNAVTVEEVKLLEDDSTKVSLQYRFVNGKSFAEFTESTFFYGTVAQAYESGYSLKGKMTSVKGDKTLSDIELKQLSKRSLVITDLRLPIYSAVTPDYVSEGVMVLEDGTIDPSNSQGLVFILLK